MPDMNPSAPDPDRLTHFDEAGQARMVDVGSKPVQSRRAVAEGRLVCAARTLELLRQQALPKGDVLAVARVAGILAAKKTAELIPLCHSLPLSQVTVDFEIGSDSIQIRCAAATDAKTGVEMEALTGVCVAALTLYDMCKAVDKAMRIEHLHLVEKTKR